MRVQSGAACARSNDDTPETGSHHTLKFITDIENIYTVLLSGQRDHEIRNGVRHNRQNGNSGNRVAMNVHLISLSTDVSLRVLTSVYSMS